MLLKYGGNLTAPGSDGQTLLHATSRSDIAMELLELEPALINLKDNSGGLFYLGLLSV